ncbi:MAG TPA: glycosyl hydrolase, partial [Gammaproteobacteria bacterium]|nr:glycosyl hydrolase [Gammaproteobacteria bacterium]
DAADTTPQALTAKLLWRNVGPYIGGRVVAVAGVPGENNLFYMGAVDGGVWKSTDYGVKWTNITDGALPGTSDSIGALAVAPSDPGIIYVGTGEGDIRGDMITGDGVFKSTDAGKTWKAAGLADTHTISALVVDPRNPDVVYAASMGHVFKPNAERGVYKSTDGGKSWDKVLFVDDNTGAIDLVMDPKDPQTLYAAMWQAYRTPWSLVSGGEGSGLYKSTDGGAHWRNLSRNPGLPQGLLGRIGVSVTAADPKVVYAIMQAEGGGVFRSDDGGASWKRVNDEWKLRQRAFYYMSIYADPKDADTVYVPEVDALWVSHDGAKTFTKLNTPHGDNHIIWINPGDTKLLLEGNDGGATVSSDGGLTWSGEYNQPTGQFYHVNLDGRFPFHIYGAQQDEGSFEAPSATDAGEIPFAAWRTVAYGESTFTVPQPGKPGVNYGSGYYSLFMKYDAAAEQYQSVSPWPDYQEGASAGELPYRMAWTHPILFSPTNPQELFVGAQFVLKSPDAGATWQRISPDLSRNDPATELPSGGPVDLDQSGAEIYATVSALAVSPLDDNLIWAGSDDGLVHVTSDGGANWKAVTPPDLPQTAYVTSIEPSHTDKGTAYMTVSRYMWDDFHPYVYETSDYGGHWTPIVQGLAGGDYAFAVRQDPRDPQLLFLGTRSTLYASYDGGAHWQPLSLNLPRVQVRDVAVDARQGQVVVATHGRAFWVLDDLKLLEQLTTAAPAGETRLFAPETAWLTHSYGQADEADRSPSSGDNPLYGATVFFRLPLGYDGKTPLRLSFTDSGGKLVRSFDLHLKSKAAEKTEAQLDAETPYQRRLDQEEKHTSVTPGMNSFQWNLCYPDATEVKGFNPPIAAGGLTDEVDGPEVMPGSYRVVLDYGGRKQQQSFDVALDPRLQPGSDALAARLALELQIHTMLDTLDKSLNEAIGVRDSLQEAAKGRRLDAAKSARAVADLDATINSLVVLDIQSSEGDLLHGSKLRSHLAYLAAEVGLTYERPSAAEYAVFKQLDDEAGQGEQELQAVTVAGRALLR